jgi:hypothetical protein
MQVCLPQQRGHRSSARCVDIHDLGVSIGAGCSAPLKPVCLLWVLIPRVYTQQRRVHTGKLWGWWLMDFVGVYTRAVPDMSL